jgi:hypothetical protein
LSVLISLLGLDKRLLVKIWQLAKLGGHHDAFRRSQLLKTAAALGTLAKVWQKKSFVPTCLVFQTQKPV